MSIFLIACIIAYKNIEREEFSFEEIVQTLETEIYYRHPPVLISFGDGFYISDIYKNEVVYKWKNKTNEEIKFDKSREWLGYPYRYIFVRGIKFDTKYPPAADSLYWLSNDPSFSTFAGDFEFELSQVLSLKDSINFLRKALNFIYFEPIEYCQPDLFLEPLNITEISQKDSYYLFQVPGTEFFYVIRFQIDSNGNYTDVMVYPWWKEMAKNAMTIKDN